MLERAGGGDNDTRRAESFEFFPAAIDAAPRATAAAAVHGEGRPDEHLHRASDLVLQPRRLGVKTIAPVVSERRSRMHTPEDVQKHVSDIRTRERLDQGGTDNKTN